MIDSKSRIVCQFSCGAASAVATKLAIAQYGATHEVVIVRSPPLAARYCTKVLPGEKPVPS